MASLIEAIDIKRKMFFEHEGAPYHCHVQPIIVSSGGSALRHPESMLNAKCSMHKGD